MKRRISWLLLCCLLCAGFAMAEGLPEEEAASIAAEEAADAGENEEAQASAVTPHASFRLLKSGSKGEDVTALQLRLRELGYDPGEADGIYGTATKQAVQAFQKRNNLSVDGAAGKQTQARLYSSEALSPLLPPEPVDVLAGDWPMLTNLERPVGEDFLPADLVKMTDYCDESLIRIKYPDTQAVRTAVEALVTMLEAARADGITKMAVQRGVPQLCRSGKPAEQPHQYLFKEKHRMEPRPGPAGSAADRGGAWRQRASSGAGL